MSAADVQAMEQGMLYRLIGRIEAAHFAETVSRKLIAQTYLLAKEEFKKVNDMVVRGLDGRPKHVSSLEAFCAAVMPVSARRCQQIVAEVGTLGEQLYEHAERIGFRARDYQALKALPADDQEAVKRALETGSRDEVLDLLSELASRNQVLRTRLEEQTKRAAAKDAVIAQKDQKLNELAERGEAEHRLSAEGRREEQLRVLKDRNLAAERALDALLAAVDELMDSGIDEAVKLSARHAVDYMAQRMVDICQARRIALNLEERVTPLHLEPVAAIVEAASVATPRKRR